MFHAYAETPLTRREPRPEILMCGLALAAEFLEWRAIVAGRRAATLKPAPRWAAPHNVSVVPGNAFKALGGVPRE